MTNTKSKCNNCDERKVCDTAYRHVGGSYRHPGSSRPCNVCEECARRLLAGITPGHRSTNRWDIISLRRAVERFDRRTPTPTCGQVTAKGQDCDRDATARIIGNAPVCGIHARAEQARGGEVLPL